MFKKIKLKKIEITIIAFVLFISVLAIFGGINIYNSCKIIKNQENANLMFLTQSIKKSMNIYFQDAQAESEDCARLIELTIDNNKLKKIAPVSYKYEKYKIPYIENYLNFRVSPILNYSIKNVEGLVSIYFIFDPKFFVNKNLIGIWYAKTDKEFKLVDNALSSTLLPENRSDLEWFYMPKKLQKGTWSGPYLDSDLKINVVSYSTPVVLNKTIIGITGIDLSMNELDNYLSKFKIYKTGKAYLISPNNKIIFAKGYKSLASTKTIDKNLYKFLNNNINKLNNKKVNIIKSKKGDLFSILSLQNGFILVIYVPIGELYGEINKLVIFTSYLLVLAILISIFIAIHAYAAIQKNNNELLHKEKLISMGKMAAEVAHEINNPLGYLNCNIDTLKKFIEKVKKFLDEGKKSLYKVQAGEETFENQMKYIEELKEEYKIDYILNSIEELITESKDGINRVSTLVLDLKNFSKDDSHSIKTKESLKKIIEEALNILNNTISSDVKIQTRVDSIPLVLCSKNQIMQVLINMIENAYHSVIDNGQSDKQIIISVYKKDKYACIDIEDNGVGIAENDTGKIFDAFFTTKKQSVGTGLGLSIAYEIVTNKHKGEILVDSEKGKGTKFTIKIPY